MIELLGTIAKLGLMIFMWVMGKKEERARRAREIADTLARIKKDGDHLAPVILTELNRRSETGWDDIPIRPFDVDPAAAAASDPSSSSGSSQSDRGPA